jgi:hypothetical protein
MAKTYNGKVYQFKKVNGRNLLFVDGKQVKQKTKSGKFTQAYKIAKGLVSGGRSCKGKKHSHSSGHYIKKASLEQISKAAKLIQDFDSRFKTRGGNNYVIPKTAYAKAKKAYLQIKALKAAKRGTSLDNIKPDYFYTGKNGGKAPQADGTCAKGDLQYLMSGEPICMRKKKKRC